MRIPAPLPHHNTHSAPRPWACTWLGRRSSRGRSQQGAEEEGMLQGAEEKEQPLQQGQPEAEEGRLASGPRRRRRSDGSPMGGGSEAAAPNRATSAAVASMGGLMGLSMRPSQEEAVFPPRRSFITRLLRCGHRCVQSFGDTFYLSHVETVERSLSVAGVLHRQGCFLYSSRGWTRRLGSQNPFVYPIPAAQRRGNMCDLGLWLPSPLRLLHGSCCSGII